MTGNKLMTLVVGLFVFAILAETVAADVPMGPAGSERRKGICGVKQAQCEEDIDDLCGESIKNSPNESAETIEVELCRAKQKDRCEAHWGESCRTGKLESDFSWEMQRHDSGGDVLSSPEETKQPLRASLQLDAATSGRVVSRDELAVNLKAGQKLILTNGSSISMADGSVHFLSMNGRTEKSYPGGKLVKDSGGKISVLSGGKRFEVGVFKAIESPANQRERRKTRDHR